MVTWFLPHRINGLITKFAVKAKHARTGQTVRTLEVNAEDIMTVALPHCNVLQYTITHRILNRLLLWNFEMLIWRKNNHLHNINAFLWHIFSSAYVLYDFVCLGCSRYPLPSNSESSRDNSISSSHHPLSRAPCSLLERTHISRSWSATTLHCLSVRSVCLHLWRRRTDSLNYGPHARVRYREEANQALHSVYGNT